MPVKKGGAGQAESAKFVDLVKPAPRAGGKAKLVAAAVVIVSFGAAVGLGVRFWLQSHKVSQPATAVTIADKSIAVLPFTDMSEKKDQEYFADGMAEEVLDLLAKIPGLTVIGRTSSFQFKGKNEDLRTIGSTLGATYVVEGWSVRKAGERLRVTAQLIDAQNGSHLWSETYNEDAGDVLKVQDQIATGLVRALQVTVRADDLQAQPKVKDAKAYDLYLRGRHAMDRFDKDGFESAAGYFQQALEIDPSLIRAAEWLGAAHEFMAEWGFVPVREGYEQARKSVGRALTLDPRSGLAHSLMCTIHLHDWNWAAAIDECNRTLELQPRDPQVLGYAGQAHTDLGQWDEAARLTTASIAVDPLFAGWHDLLAIIRDRTDRLADAEAERRKVLDISPTYERGHLDLGLTLVAEGKLELALAAIRQETADGGRDAGLAIVYHAMGRKADAAEALARFTKEHANDRAYRIAQIHAYRGDGDQAFTWLDRGYRQKDVDLWFFIGNLPFKALESDTRYKAFLRKMNLKE